MAVARARRHRADQRARACRRGGGDRPGRSRRGRRGWTSQASALEARPLRVLQPDWVDVHCRRQIGLRTDYRAERPLPPPREQPYPKDGLAVSPDQRGRSHRDLRRRESPDVRALIPALRERVQQRGAQAEAKYTIRSAARRAKASSRRSRRSTRSATTRACTTSRRHGRIENCRCHPASARRPGSGPDGSCAMARAFACWR